MWFSFLPANCNKVMKHHKKINPFLSSIGRFPTTTPQLTPSNRVLLQKLTGSHPIQKFPAFYNLKGSLPHSQQPTTCPYPQPDQSSPCPLHSTSWRSILILSSHLCLGLPSGLFPSGFPTKTLYAPLLSPICATCPTHLILLDLITQIIFGENRS